MAEFPDDTAKEGDTVRLHVTGVCVPAVGAGGHAGGAPQRPHQHAGPAGGGGPGGPCLPACLPRRARGRQRRDGWPRALQARPGPVPGADHRCAGRRAGGARSSLETQARVQARVSLRVLQGVVHLHLPRETPACACPPRRQGERRHDREPHEPKRITHEPQ